MNKQVLTALVLAAIVGLFNVGDVLASDPATQPASSPGSADWPQWRGPNRDGIAPTSPKLLDSWPKEGSTLLWKSEWIPGYREGGCGGPIVADGKVFLYANLKVPGRWLSQDTVSFVPHPRRAVAVRLGGC